MPKIDSVDRAASNVAAGRTAGGVQVVQDMPKFTPSPVEALDTTPLAERPDFSALAAGKGPMRQQQAPAVPEGTPTIQAPTAAQEEAALDITQQVGQQGTPDETSLTSSSTEYAKNYALQAGAGTLRGGGSFVGALDGLAGMVTRKIGMPKPQALAIMEDSANYWAQHLENKMSFHDYMTTVVGGVLGSAPEVVQFMMGPEWAALRATGEGQDLTGAIKAYAQRTAAGAVFGAAHTLDAPARIAAGTAYMTVENAAGQLAATGTVDAGQLAEAAGTGLGMMLTGGIGPGNKAGLRQRVNPETWFETSKQGNEIYKALEEKRLDPLTKDLAKQFYTADLMSGGTALKDTTLAVVDQVKAIRKGVDDWILRDQGIDPNASVEGQHIISGKTVIRAQGDGTYRTAIELFQGHRPDTLVEEWMHRQEAYLTGPERVAVQRAYEAYKSGLPEGAPQMSRSEFYAKGATDKFFADQVAAQKAADRPAWKKAVASAHDRWEGLVQTVRGLPGAREELPAGTPRMNEGQAFQVRDLAQEARDMVRADVPLPDQKYADESNLNLQRIEAPEDIRAALNRVSLLNAPIIAEETRGKITQEQTAALASDLGLTVEQLLARRTGVAFNAEEVLAARQMLGASSVELMKLAKMATGPAATDQSRADFRKYLETHAAIQAEVAGLTAEAGRALSIFRRKITVGETPLEIGDVQAVIEAAGGHGNIDRIATALMSLGELAADGKVDVRQINKFVRDSRKATTWDMIQEAWINSLLMQPATHIVNSASNLIVASWAIPERLTAGMIGAVRNRIPAMETGEDRVYMGEALAQAYGGFHGLIDGLRIAWGTFKSGESADPMGKVEYSRRAITAESLGIDPADPFGKALDWMATMTTGRPAGAGARGAAQALQRGIDTTLDFTVRGPTRALMAEDDFFKTIGYRMETRAQAYRKASGEGLTGKAFAERVQELTDNPPASIRLAGIEAARYQTYTNDLGKIGNALMKMRGATHEIKMRDGSTVDVPVGAPLTVIVPFVRTPLNVIKYGLARTPAGIAMPSVWADVAAGGARADLAIARITLGSTFGAFAASLAAQGLITGSGPTDPKQRQNLQAVGWLPYSVKIGDTYYQYKRLDPFSTILGLGADFAQMHEWMDDSEREDAAKLIAMSIAQNVLDKTFMTGVHGFFDAMTDPQRYGDRWLQRTASSFIPASGGMRALRNYNDPYLREVEGVMDALKNTVPGYSKTLYPRLDRYGKPINNGEYWLAMQGISPIRTSEAPNYKSETAAIDYAISENKVSIPKMGRTLWIDGVKVKMTADEYNRLQDISGNEVGLVEKLQDLVSTPQFEKMSGGPEGTKASAIRQIFDDAHKQARYVLQQETEGIPDGLDERIREAREIARMNQQGQ